MASFATSSPGQLPPFRRSPNRRAGQPSLKTGYNLSSYRTPSPNRGENQIYTTIYPHPLPSDTSSPSSSSSWTFLRKFSPSKFRGLGKEVHGRRTSDDSVITPDSFSKNASTYPLPKSAAWARSTRQRLNAMCFKQNRKTVLAELAMAAVQFSAVAFCVCILFWIPKVAFVEPNSILVRGQNPSPLFGRPRVPRSPPLGSRPELGPTVVQTPTLLSTSSFLPVLASTTFSSASPEASPSVVTMTKRAPFQVPMDTRIIGAPINLFPLMKPIPEEDRQALEMGQLNPEDAGMVDSADFEMPENSKMQPSAGDPENSDVAPLGSFRSEFRPEFLSWLNANPANRSTLAPFPGDSSISRMPLTVPVNPPDSTMSTVPATTTEVAVMGTTMVPTPDGDNPPASSYSLTTSDWVRPFVGTGLSSEGSPQPSPGTTPPPATSTPSAADGASESVLPDPPVTASPSQIPLAPTPDPDTKTYTQACNNYLEFCNRRYSNVTEVVAHNSPFFDPGNPISTQFADVISQLNDGIRALSVQVHMGPADEEVKLCPGTCIFLDAGKMRAYLELINEWIRNHHHEVVTILISNPMRIDLEHIITPIQQSGLVKLVYTPPRDDDGKPLEMDEWPTLGELIDENQRIVFFMDHEANQDKCPYIIEQKKHYWRTPSIPTNISFPCVIEEMPNEEDGLYPKFMMYAAHHNLNAPIKLGDLDVVLPVASHAKDVNTVKGPGSLGDMVERCKQLVGHPPKFLMVDFYDVGNGTVFEAAAQANNVTYTDKHCCTHRNKITLGGMKLSRAARSGNSIFSANFANLDFMGFPIRRLWVLRAFGLIWVLALGWFVY